MLEKPAIPDQLIIARLQGEYGLHLNQLTFLPLGADVNTAVYRAVAEDGSAFFLKLRKGDFDEISLAVPVFLRAQGIRAILAPLETSAGRAWGDLGAYKMILYPFVEGENAYHAALSDAHWLEFGAALKGVHSVHVPPALAGRIPREGYSARWREMVKNFQAQAEERAFDDPVAAKLALFMQGRRAEISRLAARAGQLALALQARELEFVLCHADIHAGNLLVAAPDGSANDATASNPVYIVDWDNPIFAPKEHDLALIGGCKLWSNPHDIDLFYQGYGQTGIDAMALAYYRCERIVLDIAAYCEQLFLTSEGGEDREQSYLYFTSQFLAGHELDLAFKTDPSQFFYNESTKFRKGSKN